MRLTLGTLLLLHQASRKMLQLEEQQKEALMSAIRGQSGKGKVTVKCLGTTSDHQETQQADPLEMNRHAIPQGPQGMLGTLGLQEQAEAMTSQGLIKVFTVHHLIKGCLMHSGMSFDCKFRTCDDFLLSAMAVWLPSSVPAVTLVTTTVFLMNKTAVRCATDSFSWVPINSCTQILLVMPD